MAGIVAQKKINVLRHRSTRSVSEANSNWIESRATPTPLCHDGFDLAERGVSRLRRFAYLRLAGDARA